jgi:1,4-alpha-glucan branching enzyme
MFGHPGKKLMFMGSEFGQDTEWNHDSSLPWHLLERPEHTGIQRLVRDLNRLYRDTPALHALDCDAAGFEWLVTDDAANSTFAWLRKGSEPTDRCVVVVNFTPQLNSDSSFYGGSNVGNAGSISTTVTRDSPELHIVLPPLAAIFFVPEL